jgi:hypothetical protein
MPGNRTVPFKSSDTAPDLYGSGLSGVSAGAFRDQGVDHASGSIDNSLIGQLVFDIVNGLDKPVQVQFQASWDNGATWINYGSPVGLATVSSIQTTITDPVPKIRANSRVVGGAAGTSGALAILWSWREGFATGLGGLLDLAWVPQAAKFIPLNAVSVNAEATLWTPASGKRFRLLGYSLAQGTAAGAVIIKDNTAGTTILIIPKNTLDIPQISPPMGKGILSAAPGNVLTGTGVATETLTGFLYGTEE